MQGYGLFIMEQLIHSPDGVLLTRGPGAYKIPSFGDIPAEFNVSLLRGASNPKAVYSSKGIGEPPLFLSSSVFFAIRHAIKAARCQSHQHLMSSFLYESVLYSFSLVTVWLCNLLAQEYRCKSCL